VEAALAELQHIRAEISHMEHHVATLKTAGQHMTTLGRTVLNHTSKPARKTAARPDHFAPRKREWERDRLQAHSTLPVSRHEAVVLDQTLEQLLPAGLVSASLQVGGAGGARGMDVGLFEKQYELVDMVLMEAARQVPSLSLSLSLSAHGGTHALRLQSVPWFRVSAKDALNSAFLLRGVLTHAIWCPANHPPHTRDTL
jgi:hypothetical protein